MDIDTARIALKSVTAADVQRVFADPSLRGDFVTLSVDADTFIQVSGEGDGPYVLEYGQGGALFRATDNPDAKAAESALLDYLAGRVAWKTRHVWVEAPSPSGLMLCLWVAALIGRDDPVRPAHRSTI